MVDRIVGLSGIGLAEVATYVNNLNSRVIFATALAQAFDFREKLTDSVGKLCPSFISSC